MSRAVRITLTASLPWKMKAVQPEMANIRECYGDDKMKQQQARVELWDNAGGVVREARQA